MENEIKEVETEKETKQEWSLWHKIIFYVLMPISMMFW
jgi:hypothetical protein